MKGQKEMALTLWAISEGEDASDGAAEHRAAPACVNGVYVATLRRCARRSLRRLEASRH